MEAQTFGRYEIRAEIGRGGMARVYRAFDPRFKREVAIKVLPPELLENPTFRARFEREAQAIAALEHPAIVPVYDVGEENGQPYIVMRLMNGGSLSDRLTGGPLKLSEVSRILNHVAPALDKAHAAGIIHRDLKPANVLFDEENHPYIADFGLARLAEPEATLTVTGIYGTPAYMSPEQARGEAEVDGRSDVYSLGAMLYQLLSGRLPFEATTPIGLALRHVTDVPPRISRLRPDLPAACDSIILRAMAKDPDARFATADELKRAIDAVATAAPLPEWITTTPVDALESAAGPMAVQTLRTATPWPVPVRQTPEVSIALPGRGVRRIRWPWLVLGLGGLLALGLGLGALASLQLRPTPTPLPTAVQTGLEVGDVQATVTAAIAPFTRERFDEIERAFNLPVVEGQPPQLVGAGRVVDANERLLRYELLAVDALVGERLWDTSITITPQQTERLEFDGQRLYWTDGDTITVTERLTGALTWRAEQPVRVGDCPLSSCFRVKGDVLITITPEDEIVALGVTTGEERWSHALDGARWIGDLGNELTLLGQRGADTFALELVSAGDGSSREFSPTCEVDGQTFTVGASNIVLRPISDLYYLIFTGEPGCIQSYDLGSNALNWSQPVTALNNTFRQESDGLYVSTGSGIVRFDQQTGATTLLGDSGGRVMLDVVGTDLLMRDEDANEEALVVVDAQTGVERWQFPTLPARATEGGRAVAAFARLQPGQQVWTSRYSEAGWLVFTYRALSVTQAEFQVDRLAWADGALETLFVLPVTPPSGEVTVPSLLSLRDNNAWWTFDDRYILRLDLDTQSLTPIWPP